MFDFIIKMNNIKFLFKFQGESVLVPVFFL